MRKDIERYCDELAEVIRTMPYRSISKAADILLECHERQGTVFVIGNGGSAATASHFACDLSKGTRCDDLPSFRVVPLTDNMPILTAWANDTSYDRVFAEQLVGLLRPHDVVVAISVSGNSTNIIAAVEAVREAQATTIALTGHTGGRLRRLAYLSIPTPAESVEQAEDAHLVICHALCVALRSRLRALSNARSQAHHTASADPIAVNTGL